MEMSVELLTTIVEAIPRGRHWTLIDGQNLLETAKGLRGYVECSILNNIYRELPQQDERADRRFQVLLFSILRERGCVAIGWRSGSLDGCCAFLGMRTLCLDLRSERGFARVEKLKPLITHADIQGQGGIDFDRLRAWVGLFLAESSDPATRGAPTRTAVGSSSYTGSRPMSSRAEHRPRKRTRSRSPERRHDFRGRRESERERGRHRDRSRDRDRYGDRERSRNRDRYSDRDRDRSRFRDRERERTGDRRRRSRDRS